MWISSGEVDRLPHGGADFLAASIVESGDTFLHFLVPWLGQNIHIGVLNGATCLEFLCSSSGPLRPS